MSVVESTVRMSWRDRLTPSLIALAISAAVLFLFGLLTDTFWLRVTIKPMPVWILSGLVWSYRKDTMGRIVAAALLVSGVGDVLLEIDAPGMFLAGMLAFLLGHLGYVVAFLRESRGWQPLALLPFVAWGAVVTSLSWEGLGALRWPVMIYMSVILTMMWRATSWVAASRVRPVWLWCIMAGAMSYGLSDSLIALNKFHHPLQNIRPPIILTYWAGQALIALATVKLAAPSRIEAERASAHER